MGRPKGSKNKPKPPPPELLQAAEWAKEHGYEPPEPTDAGPARVPVPADFREFLAITKIRAKRGGKLITPVLNDEQEALYEAWLQGDLDLQRHMLVLKPRKIGVTTFFALLFAHKFLTCEDPVTLVYLANKQATATEIMQMVKTAIAALPEEMRPKFSTNQARKIAREHPDNPGTDGATLIVDTAKGEGGIRGYTPFWLAISEVNFCRGAEELRASSFSAVPVDEGGRIVLESTASHVGDVMHEEMQKAKAGLAELPWKILFFPWFVHQTYRRSAPHFQPTEEEQKLADLHELDDEQLAWRRQQMATIGERKFPREFPATIDDAYSSLEGQWFQPAQLAELEVLDGQAEGVVIWEPFDPREAYAASLDCAAGTGGDATSGLIYNVRTKRPAARYRSTTDPPERGAEDFWNLLLQYGCPLTLVEYNSWGIPYIQALTALRANLYMERAHEADGLADAGVDRYFITNARTRVEVLEDFKTHVLTGALPCVDSICLEEAKAARVDKNGQIVFPRSKKNGHGDVLMAYALVLRCARHVSLPPPPPTPGELREREMAQQRALAGLAPGARY